MAAATAGSSETSSRRCELGGVGLDGRPAPDGPWIGSEIGAVLAPSVGRSVLRLPAQSSRSYMR